VRPESVASVSNPPVCVFYVVFRLPVASRTTTHSVSLALPLGHIRKDPGEVRECCLVRLYMRVDAVIGP
jgi:hypothetical protein